MRVAQLTVGLVIAALLAAILILLLTRLPVDAPEALPSVNPLCPTGTGMAVWYVDGVRHEGCVQTDGPVLPTP